MRPDVARPSTSSSQGWELCSEEILSPGDMYTAASPARDNLNNYLPLRTSVVGFSLHPLMTLLQLSSSPQLLALAWQYVMFLHARSPRQIKITEPLPSICKVMVLLWLYPVSIYIPSPLVLVIMTSLQPCIWHYSHRQHPSCHGGARPPDTRIFALQVTSPRGLVITFVK